MLLETCLCVVFKLLLCNLMNSVLNMRLLMMITFWIPRDLTLDKFSWCPFITWGCQRFHHDKRLEIVLASPTFALTQSLCTSPHTQDCKIQTVREVTGLQLVPFSSVSCTWLIPISHNFTSNSVISSQNLPRSLLLLVVQKPLGGLYDAFRALLLS